MIHDNVKIRPSSKVSKLAVLNISLNKKYVTYIADIQTLRLSSNRPQTWNIQTHTHTYN